MTDRPNPDRRMIITVGVSLGLHALAVAVALLFLHAGVRQAVVPDTPAEVQLVLEEHAGDARPVSAPAPSQPPSDSKTPSQEAEKRSQAAQGGEKKPAETQTESPPVRAPVEAQRDAREQVAEPPQTVEQAPTHTAAKTPDRAAAPESSTLPQPAPDAARPVATAAPPAAQPAPTISLRGTDSPSDARAFGDRILPAAPDAVFHNRPPEYPIEAVQNGEQGAVVVVVHISPAGRAAGVDVERSSGYVLLDEAARAAVLRWRFLPAVKDGQPVASDIEMQFVFENQ